MSGVVSVVNVETLFLQGDYFTTNMLYIHIEAGFAAYFNTQITSALEENELGAPFWDFL